MPTKYHKPRALTPGDTVAVISPSWGGPSEFPHIFEAGLHILHGWGLRTKEYPSTRLPAAELARQPALRAHDVNSAFGDDSVAAIWASIGGDDSVLLLPHLNKQLIAANPKILIGFSDTTTLLVYAHLLAGMVTFHGPSVMAGIAQLSKFPQRHRAHIHDMLFTHKSSLTYKPYSHYSDGYRDWSDPSYGAALKPLQFSRGWQFLQGNGIHHGETFGGCIEVLEWLKGSPYWPTADFWQGKILFLETSEEKPSITDVTRWLRSYGIQDVFRKVAGVLIGRARDYTLGEQIALDVAVLQVIRDEFGATTIPIVTNVDIGHTDPQFIVPLGITMQIDCNEQRISLTEPWLS